MIKVLSSVLLIGIVFLLLYWRQRAHEKIWVKGYAPVAYLQASQANSDPWRWRKPHNKLRIPYNAVDRPGIRDTPDVSSFVFRREFRLADLTFPCLGIALISFNLLLIFNSTVSAASFLPVFSIYFFLLCLGVFLLQYGYRVLQINLYPDRIEIVSRFANFFPQTTVYKRHQLFSIKGKIQTFWTMESAQIQPDYKLIIERPLLGYLQIKQTFRLRCDPTQGSWIVGGLDHWKSLSNE